MARGGIEAGRLDRRVTILRATPGAEDGFGHRAEIWAEIAEVWAEVRPISDGERWRRSEAELPQIAATATHRFRIRWGVGVTVMDRLRFEDREFEIAAVKEIGRRVGQEITATARAE